MIIRDVSLLNYEKLNLAGKYLNSLSCLRGSDMDKTYGFSDLALYSALFAVLIIALFS